MTVEVNPDPTNPLWPINQGTKRSERKLIFDTARFLDVRNLGLKMYKKNGEPLLGFNESLDNREFVKGKLIDFELEQGWLQHDATAAPAPSSPMNGVQPNPNPGAPQMTTQAQMPFNGASQPQQPPAQATPQQLAQMLPPSAPPQMPGQVPGMQPPQASFPTPQGFQPQGAPPAQFLTGMTVIGPPPAAVPQQQQPQMTTPDEAPQPAQRKVRRPKNSGAAVSPPPPLPPAPEQPQQTFQPQQTNQNPGVPTMQPTFPQPQQGFQPTFPAAGGPPGMAPQAQPQYGQPPTGYAPQQGMPPQQQPNFAPVPQAQQTAQVDLSPVIQRLDILGKGIETLAKNNEALASQNMYMSQQLQLVQYQNKQLLAVLHHLYLTHPSLGPNAAQAKTLADFEQYLTQFVGPVPK